MAVIWNRNGDQGVWVISLQPYAEELLLAKDIDANPVGWSPDAKWLFVIKKRELLKVALANPNHAVPVATLPGDLMESNSASVSPDGKEAVVSLGETKSDVWIIENFDPSAATTKN